MVEQSNDAAPEPAVPVGMKAWDGRYGPPRDVDHNKPVLRRNGRQSPTPITGNQWLHVASHAGADIIAYTPTPSDVSNDAGGEGRVRLDRDAYDTFVEFEGWLSEYRDTMDPAVMRLWAKDVIDTGKRILNLRDQTLDGLSAPPPVQVGEVERYRHVKRGTTYEIVGRAELQASSELPDGAGMLVYRGEDGRLWVRDEGEFMDGRFERIAPTPVSQPTEARIRAEGER